MRLVEFRILGPVEVHCEGRAVALGGTQQRALLALFLIHANQPISTSRLVEEFLGDPPPERAVKRVQVAVTRLRKALDVIPREAGADGRLRTVPGGYQLTVAADELDSERFEADVTAGRRELRSGAPGRAAEILRMALATWRGPALEDVAHESFAQAEIRRLEDLRAHAAESAIDAEIADGRHAEVVGELETLVARHPLREHLHAQLMLALYRSGRQADALAVFHVARRRLVDEIGVEPGPELQQILAGVLAHDASLDLPAPRVSQQVGEPQVDLPPQLEIAAAAPLAGRDDELARLRVLWGRAGSGAGGLVTIVGEAGSGKTRLAAEIAAEAHAGGADVFYANGGAGGDAVADTVRRAGAATRPTLVVVDDCDRAGGAAIDALARLSPGFAAGPVLALATAAGTDALARLGGEGSLTLGPLDVDAVRQIAAAYAPAQARSRVPGQRLLEISGGVPARVHEVTSAWARQDAAQRVEAIAGRTAAGGDDLRTLQRELAGGIVDLQAARDQRARLVDRALPPVCPFKGLASFDIDDAEYFFGRERLVAEIVARLVGTPLLGIVGPSGSGKSSVLRAGLLRALADGVLPGSETWPQVVMLPGEHPVRELERVRARADGARSVLAIDQFEEVFTACRDERERQAFIAALVRAADPRAGRTLVVLTLRADFYGSCAAYPELSELLAGGTVLVAPMQRDELRRAIERPTAEAGLRIEPELVDALLDEVVSAPGALPLLSAALLELWQDRDGRWLRLTSYERTGGVRGAVARLAEDVFGRLAPAQQILARRVLLRLAGEGAGAAIVRRRVPLAELENDRGDDVAQVVGLLADRRLVTITEDTVDIAHEALLREWPRLRGWLEEDAAGRRLHRQLSEVARDWDDRGRDAGDLYRGARLASALEWRAGHDDELNPIERAFLDASRAAGQRAQRRLRTVLVALASLLVLAVAGAAVALDQAANARAEALTADAERLGIQALTEPRIDRALLLARQGVALADTPATQGNLLAALLRSPAALGTIGRAASASALDAHPGGRLLAAALFHGTGTDSQGRFCTTDSVNQSWLGTAPDRCSVPLTPDRWVVHFLDATTRRPAGRPYDTGVRVSALRFSPDGARLAVAATGDDGSVVVDLLDTSTRQPINRSRIPPLAVGERLKLGRLVFSPDSSVLAADLLRGSDSPVRVQLLRWSARDGHPLRGEPTIGRGSPALVGFTSGGTQLVASNEAGGTTVLDAATLREVARYVTWGTSSVLSPDGRLLALGSTEGVVTLLDLRTGRRRSAAVAQTAAVTAMAFSRDGAVLVTGADNGQLIAWDPAGLVAQETLQSGGSPILQISVAPDGQTAYSVDQDKVTIWDLARTRRLSRAFTLGPERGGALPYVAVAAGGASIVALDREGYAGVLDTRTLTRGGRIRIGPPPDLRPGARDGGLAVAPDGYTMATTAGGRLGFWDLRTRTPLGPPARAGGTDHSPVFSADGRWLVTAVGDQTVRLWDARRHVLVSERKLDGSFQRLSISPRTGELATIVSIGENGVYRNKLESFSLPDLTPRQRVEAMRSRDRGYTGDFASDGTLLVLGGPLLRAAQSSRTVAISPDGATLATASWDGIARLWDVASNRPIGPPLPGLGNQIAGAAFVHNGSRLAVVYDGGRGSLWDVRPAAWAARACAIAGGTLTADEWRLELPGRDYEPACVGS